MSDPRDAEILRLRARSTQLKWELCRKRMLIHGLMWTHSTRHPNELLAISYPGDL